MNAEEKNAQLLRQLVDLYVDNELPGEDHAGHELKDEVQRALLTDMELAADAQTLRTTLDMLRSAPPPTDTATSLRAIFNRIREEAGIEQEEPSIHYLQHYLPFTG